MELADGAAEEIVITAHGALADHDTRVLGVAALDGAFQGRADRPVNFVNAPSIAAERGVEVREERSRTARDYTSLLSVEVRAGGSSWRVAGTTFGSDDRPWLVNILGFEIELELAPLFVLCRYDDVPGVIGRVGTLFGKADINIAGNDRLARHAWRQGAHGAHGRLAAIARARRAASRRGPRRRARDRALMAERWPEPVERVAAVLRDSGIDARVEEFREGTPTARAAAKAVGAELNQIVKSLLFICDGRPDARARPRRPARRRDEGRGRCGREGSARREARKRFSRRRASSLAASHRFRLRPSPRFSSSRSSSRHEQVWIGAGSERHMAGISPVDLVRLTNARAGDLTET